jgi:hypothetical protein
MIVAKEIFYLLSIAYFVLDNVMFWEAFRWERLDMGHIYIQKFENGKMYAGLTIDLKRRMNDYKKLKGNTKHHTNALKKYIDTMQIAFTQCPNYLLDAVEIFVIAFFDLTDTTKGYNKQTGGRKGYRMSKEACMRVSIANTGKIRTKEMRAKISKGLTGKTLTEAHRANISIAHIGKTHTKEARAKISIAHIGKTHTEVSCAKMSKKKKGENNPKAKPISVFGKLYGTAKDASNILRDVCDTTSNGNFMTEWTKRKKYQHNVFYVSKEFYTEMRDTAEIITRDMYENWISQM